MRIIAFSACAAALLVSTSVAQVANAQPEPAAPSAAAAMVTTPQYMMMAGASDLYEIQSSQAVLQTAKNPDVRKFAQMMIDHHTMTTKELMKGAKAAGLTPPPPKLDAAKAKMLSDLQAASGADREALYVKQQVMAHQEALALHSGYAQNGDNAALKAVAAKATPIVQQHLTEIQRISSQSGM